MRNRTLTAAEDGSEIGAHLRIVFSPDKRVTRDPIPLPRDLTLIGRDVGDQGISISDPRVSRLHVRIGWDGRGGVHRLGDAGSSNGSAVNGQPVTSAALAPDDVIRVGDTLAVYETTARMTLVRERAARGAASPLSVLLQGETGTGKEVLARFIHDQSGRQGPFVPVNCATLPRELIAAELFGHTRGAFSGAKDARPGLFVSAAEGTLFLDEVGELPLELQPSLLRALQQRAVRPVGGDREIPVNTRVVAATNVDLERAVQDGLFRADLYARLAEVTLELPPLRERRSEIMPLMHHFASECELELNLTPDAAESLLLWDWPYNVRELESFTRSFAAVGPKDGRLDTRYLRETKPQMLEPVARRHTNGEGTPATGDTASPRSSSPDREALKQALAAHRGNVSSAAKAMGKPRAQIYRWLKFYGLKAQDFR